MQAEIYESEGDDEQAYLLLFRHAHLVLTNLAAHPDHTAEALKEPKKLVHLNLAKLERLSPRIKRRYARYQEVLSEREAQRLALLEAEGQAEGQAEGLPVERFEAEEVAFRAEEPMLVAPPDLAVMAQEVSRRRLSIDHQNYSYPTAQKPVVPPKEPVPPRPPKSPKSPAYTFPVSSYLESGTPLRTLFLPPTLRASFLTLALSNTTRNLETCAFLAGSLISNALFVSKLVVPRQTATSDTCEMTHESDLFDYIDSTDLMILGWIHTHPTQTCFMSSRDLHTHAGYQMMLPESVAVVCAPSKGDVASGGEWGVYRLTDPPGRGIILACTQPGIFHPHESERIYTDALPGHAVEAKGLDFEVVDLR